ALTASRGVEASPASSIRGSTAPGLNVGATGVAVIVQSLCAPALSMLLRTASLFASREYRSVSGEYSMGAAKVLPFRVRRSVVVLFHASVERYDSPCDDTRATERIVRTTARVSPQSTSHQNLRRTRP